MLLHSFALQEADLRRYRRRQIIWAKISVNVNVADNLRLTDKRYRNIYEGHVSRKEIQPFWEPPLSPPDVLQLPCSQLPMVALKMLIIYLLREKEQPVDDLE